MIATLRRELFGRLLAASGHHLREALTEYLSHCNMARPHRALGQLHRLTRTSGHRRSISPDTGSAESRSSAASRTTTRSPLNG
jgi:hypothetical protein